jgi:subtilisin family serine protease
MLGAGDSGVSYGIRTRLVVEATRPVNVSVLPSENPARAQEVSLESGIPERLLRIHDAVVRQTHRRAGVVVLEVPADRQSALRRDLEAAGFAARPPRPLYALLNESVQRCTWRLSGVRELRARKSSSVSSTRARTAIQTSEIASSRTAISPRAAADEVGHGTHVTGIVAGAGAVFRGVAPKASLVIAKALSIRGGTEDTVLAALSWVSRQKVDVVNL